MGVGVGVEGVFKLANGDVYDGEYKDDSKNGRGAGGGRGV